MVGWTLIACGLICWARRPETRSGLLLAATGFAGSPATSASTRCTSTAGRSSRWCSRTRRGGPRDVSGRPRRRLRPSRSFRRSARSAVATVDPRGVPAVALAGAGYVRARAASARDRLAALCARATSPSSSRESRSPGSPARRTQVWRRRCSSTRPGSASCDRPPRRPPPRAVRACDGRRAAGGALRDTVRAAARRARTGARRPVAGGRLLDAGALGLRRSGRSDARAPTPGAGRSGHADRAATATPSRCSSTIRGAGRSRARGRDRLGNPPHRRERAPAGGGAGPARGAGSVAAPPAAVGGRGAPPARGAAARRRRAAATGAPAHARLGERARRCRLRDGRRIEQAETQLAQTLASCASSPPGLHPRALAEDGLAGALASLAERSPVPVELAHAAGRLPEEVEVATYFVCSEALANVAKHASRIASSVRVEDSAPARLEIEVVDDGVGGADPSGGSGLRGLRDRVESLGGRLRVESPPGDGTRVTAELPLGDVARRRPDPAPGRA